MGEQTVHEKARSIRIDGDPRRVFFLIHGYTGSPTDFNGLPALLHERFNATVVVPRLAGHGTRVEDLDALRCEHFIRQVEAEYQALARRGASIVLGGHSFGGQLALYLAAKYGCAGVFTTTAPYLLRFPLRLAAAVQLARLKKRWPKRIPQNELAARKESFYYSAMPAAALGIVQAMNRMLQPLLPAIRCPILTVQSLKDQIAHPKSAEAIEKAVVSRIKKTILLTSSTHGIFYSSERESVPHSIISFFTSSDIFQKTMPETSSNHTVAAIVPAFNEGARVRPVLETLSRTPVIKDIVLIDDGSDDRSLEAIAKEFPRVRFLRNDPNRGKGYSMERGVQATDADIIFFCDADLVSLTPEIVSDIIRPVLTGTYDMFIGIRNNVAQKSFLPFALNSGERALRREFWEQLPAFYKDRFRIEVGMNYFVRHHGKGYGYKVFPYYQTAKERKYGFWKGEIRRWKMNYDVSLAWLHAQFVSRFQKFEKVAVSAPEVK